MTNRVLLNNVDHADLRVIARHGPEFGDSVNQVLVLPTEFEAVQREYPIFFRRDANGELQAVALLGLDRDENLFLSGGGWNARYVPAVQQRGPFSIAMQSSGEPMLHIDLDHPRVSATEGEALFLPAGGNSPYLQHVARLMGLIYDGLEVSRPFFKALEDADLIEAVDVQATLGDGREYALPGLFTIGQNRLAALGGEDLERLHRTGALRAAHMVAASLGNMPDLIDAKRRRLAAA
ncbi:SapC family protein [Phenylobacterium sp. J367]|uniref:SapC family protein n=1 Tax=Phenylobacterium sp. J367 TaxID=2898435 RepID=UPI002151FB9C|nr:SapC family protein [Phenylobacterium sp. J367]MCR5881071.1 SapC family protein [Phenylobacterium sp. J367]